MSILGLVFGFAVARGLPDAPRIALVGALPRSPVVGLILASALANRESPASTTPATPVPPVVTPIVASESQINLSWTPTLGATAYNVRRGLGTGQEQLIAANLSGLSYPDTGLDDDKTYFYIVDAVVGASTLSSPEVSAQPA